jgi:hypothetical protein
VNCSYNFCNNSFSVTESVNSKIHLDLFNPTHSFVCIVFEIHCDYTVKRNTLMPYHTVIHVFVHQNYYQAPLLQTFKNIINNNNNNSINFNSIHVYKLARIKSQVVNNRNGT